jgi:hypothetical protein
VDHKGRPHFAQRGQCFRGTQRQKFAVLGEDGGAGVAGDEGRAGGQHGPDIGSLRHWQAMFCPGPAWLLNDQKFFGSFFQKRTASLHLPYLLQ